MINKILFYFFVLTSFVLAKDFVSKVQDIELAAKEVHKNGNIVRVNGDVFVYSHEYLISADEAIYNQDSQVIELFGNVNIMKGMNFTSRANYVKIDLKNSTEFFEDNFLIDKENELWMQNEQTCSNVDDLRTKGTIISSCNVQNPDWSIHFTSGKVNKESKFLHVFNPVFYIKKVPIFYLPYFGFPLDTTRRTGLLAPKMGYSKKEGFVYRQPIYFAPQNWWDLTLNPEIRTNRGQGIFSSFRFVDSQNSKGEIRFGEFKDKKSYFKERDLKYQTHKGYEIKYERDKLLGYFLKGDYQEGLWLDYTKVNNIDYLNLEDGGNRDRISDALVTSRANYFAATNKNYFGIYAKYYQNTSRDNNDNTLQDLPILQYHRFSDSVIFDKLLYSFDYKHRNYTRKIGTKAQTNEFSLPTSFSQALFKDYINFKFEEGFYYLNVNYDRHYVYINDEYQKKKQSNYFNNYHKFTLSTDLIKAYNSFYHTAYFAVDYLIPGYQKGSIDRQILNEEKLQDYKDKNGKFPANPNASFYEDNFIGENSKDYTTRNTNANLIQYLYNSSGKKLFMQQISQGYNFKIQKATNLANKVDFYFPYNITLQNELEYNYEYKTMQKFQTSLNYSDSIFSFGTTHTYKKNIRETNDKAIFTKESYLTLNSSLNAFDFYKVKANWDYDYENRYTKSWSFGFGENKRCWNYFLTYKQDYEPIMTKSGIKTNRISGIMLEFNLYPLGGVNFESRIHKKEAELD